MSKKTIVVNEIGEEQEVTTAPTLPTYPKVPQGEGVDPLTAGPTIPNIEPNNQA